VPFVYRVSYKHTLKEEAIRRGPARLVTKDNNSGGGHGGALIFRWVDAKLASYGINDYRYAAMQVWRRHPALVGGQIELADFEEL